MGGKTRGNEDETGPVLTPHSFFLKSQTPRSFWVFLVSGLKFLLLLYGCLATKRISPPLPGSPLDCSASQGSPCSELQQQVEAEPQQSASAVWHPGLRAAPSYPKGRGQRG